MKLKISIAAFLIGLMVFYLFAVFGKYNQWAWAYFFWEKMFGAGVFVWVVIYNQTTQKKIVAPIISFCIIRYCWQIISYFTGVSVNNSWAVALLFLALTICTTALILNPLSPISDWLKKHLKI